MNAIEHIRQADTILVTFLMHLGDLVLTTPFLHVLRQAAPQAKITYLVDEKLKDIVQYNRNIDEVITIDKKGKDNSITALWNYAQKLRARRFDLLISLHPNERCSFLCAASGANYKAGAVHRMFQPFFDAPIRLDRTKHAADMYIEVLTKLGVADISHQGLEMWTAPEHDAAAERFFTQHDLGDAPLIGFNIGSAVLTKRWASERFAQVADTLAARGYRTIFFGGTMDQELVAQTTAQMQSKPIMATGAFSLGELAAAMRRCSLIITNDSGPMHVAITQKVPIVALYGPSNPKLYGPYTDLATVVTAQPPCPDCGLQMKHTCPSLRCMKELTVEQVLRAAERWLEKNEQ